MFHHSIRSAAVSIISIFFSFVSFRNFSDICAFIFFFWAAPSQWPKHIENNVHINTKIYNKPEETQCDGTDRINFNHLKKQQWTNLFCCCLLSYVFSTAVRNKSKMLSFQQKFEPLLLTHELSIRESQTHTGTRVLN